MTGRPSTFTQETADEICRRIAEGETLRQICRDENTPARSTVNLWLSLNEVFSDQYARACKVRGGVYAERMLEEAFSEEREVQRSKLIVDTLKWAASKADPKRYGDKLTLGGDGKDGAIHVNLTATDAKL